MASLKATLTNPILLLTSTTIQLKAQNPRWVSSHLKRSRDRTGVQCCCTSSDGKVGILKEVQVQVGDEMRRVAYVQAEAFHEPVALFNDFFFEFFKN